MPSSPYTIYCQQYDFQYPTSNTEDTASNGSQPLSKEQQSPSSSKEQQSPSSSKEQQSPSSSKEQQSPSSPVLMSAVISHENLQQQQQSSSLSQSSTKQSVILIDDSLPRPQTNMLSHGYQSSVSSISSTGSISPLPGLINYSPKHSRKINSFHVSKNTKNLSLNLTSSNGSSSKLNQPNTICSNRNGLSIKSSIDSPTKSLHNLRISQLSENNKTIMYSQEALQTPSVTHTPKLPPPTPRQLRPTSCKSDYEKKSYKFPLSYISPEMDDNISSMSGIIRDSNSSRIERERIFPPAPPPFALDSKSSPLSAPPRLPSPDQVIASSTSTSSRSCNKITSSSSSPSSSASSSSSSSSSSLSPPTKLSKNIKKMSIESPLETNFSKEITESTSLFHVKTPQNLTYNSKLFKIPYELQESTAINAYPTGPRNVLNNLIFLYSDPHNKIDINQYNLVINVAKECLNLSHIYLNQERNHREYVHVPWSHTSLISEDLSDLTTKIDYFLSRGLKILVHCQCGVSRSACVIVAYFMKKFNLGVNEAYEMLKNGKAVNDTSLDTGSDGKDGALVEKKIEVEKCDHICPNMSLIFELMEFGDKLNSNVVTTSQLLTMSPSRVDI
ncbi:CPP1 [Candida oxycetoniae]|uniref:protein-tyrosine-phosphatase n=1 Tax=Candida oxycetoniae TaxID=497107 RepID=A0AAI9T229_9ASCO|nr:CPP1 [Candida oxycetoniae]KAI3407130.2 CPP1 [Candida oxycetoniae]